jgi:uncharacterized membrane protein YeaQ/YmgE (transglycosylase-associated protein family)
MTVIALPSEFRITGTPGTDTAPSTREAPLLLLILQLIIVGLIAGAIARLLVPGRDPLGCLGTILLGMVGSFIGGFLGWLLFGRDTDGGAIQPSGLFGSIVGAVIALLIWRRFGTDDRRRRPR